MGGNRVEIFKHNVSVVFHVLTRIFCIFPVDKRKIVFESYTGTQYSCSPKYICEYIDRQNAGYRLLWVYRDNPLDCPYRQIKRNSIAYFFHILTAGTVVINSGHNNLVRLRRNQVFINTWHGGGAYKKIVHPGYREHYRKNDFFLSSCAMASRYVIREGNAFNGRILETGLPRNDMLINPDGAKAEAIKENLGISGKKCVLYAPTFRENREKTDFGLDYDRLIRALSAKFGGDWVVLHRSHYHMDGEKASGEEGRYIDVTGYPDMQELLLAADVLVTDYSSSVWDYSFTFRPLFLFAPDLDSYDTERSFFVDIREWPFPLATDNGELEQAIGSFDETGFRKAVTDHHDMMGSFETGHATETVCDFIDAKAGN